MDMGLDMGPHCADGSWACRGKGEGCEGHGCGRRFGRGVGCRSARWRSMTHSSFPSGAIVLLPVRRAVCEKHRRRVKNRRAAATATVNNHDRVMWDNM